MSPVICLSLVRTGVSPVPHRHSTPAATNAAQRINSTRSSGRFNGLARSQATASAVVQDVNCFNVASTRSARFNGLPFMCVAKITTRPGFEPGQAEPKSAVLPLHHRVSELSRILAANHCWVNQSLRDWLLASPNRFAIGRLSSPVAARSVLDDHSISFHAPSRRRLLDPSAL